MSIDDARMVPLMHSEQLYLENSSACCNMVLAHKPQLLVVHGGKSDEAKHLVKQRLSAFISFNPSHGSQKDIEL